MGRPVVVIPAPVISHYALAQVAEWTMKVPLVATAQVRMLTEGVTDPAQPASDLPGALQPRLPFDDTQIRAALPKPGGFGWADLLIAR